MICKPSGHYCSWCWLLSPKYTIVAFNEFILSQAIWRNLKTCMETVIVNPPHYSKICYQNADLFRWNHAGSLKLNRGLSQRKSIAYLKEWWFPAEVCGAPRWSSCNKTRRCEWQWVDYSQAINRFTIKPDILCQWYLKFWTLVQKGPMYIFSSSYFCNNHFTCVPNLLSVSKKFLSWL